MLEVKKETSYEMKLMLYLAISLKVMLDNSVPCPAWNGEVEVDMINEPKIDRESENTTTVHAHFLLMSTMTAHSFFPQLPMEYGEIIASCDGFVSKIDQSKPVHFQNQHFDLQSNGQEIIVNMEPSATFSGKVVNEEGQVVEGTIIAIWPYVSWNNFYSEIFLDNIL